MRQLVTKHDNGFHGAIQHGNRHGDQQRGCLVVGVTKPIHAGVQNAKGAGAGFDVVGQQRYIALIFIPVDCQQVFIVFVKQRHVKCQQRCRDVIPGRQQLRLLRQLPFQTGNIVLHDVPAVQKLPYLRFLGPF